MLDTARDLFVRHGFRGTTLEAIIAGAGGSRETVYRVFGGKHGLFSAIISEVGERLATASVAPTTLSLPPREGLTKIAEDLVAIWRSKEGRAINRVVVSEGLESPDLVEAWFKRGIELSLNATAQYLESQVRAGTLVDLDATLVARQFATLLIGEMAYPMISRTTAPADPAKQIAHCVELILRAYCPAPPRASRRVRKG